MWEVAVRNFSDPWLDLRLRNGVSVSGTVHRVGETGIHEVRELVSQGLPVPLAVALAMTGFGVSRRLFYEIVGWRGRVPGCGEAA